MPEVASSTPARIRISVVLPAPLGPSRPNIPLGTSRSIPDQGRDRAGIDLHEVANR